MNKFHILAFFLGILVMLVISNAFFSYLLTEKSTEVYDGPLVAGTIMFLAILGAIVGLLFNPIDKSK